MRWINYIIYQPFEICDIFTYITLFTSKTLLCGIFHQSCWIWRIFHIIFSIVQNFFWLWITFCKEQDLTSHNIFQFHNDGLWYWPYYREHSSQFIWMMKYFADYCQSQRTLLWIWTKLCKSLEGRISSLHGNLGWVHTKVQDQRNFRCAQPCWLRVNIWTMILCTGVQVQSMK